MDPMASIIVASKNILDLGDLTHSPEVSVPSESFSQAVSHFNRAIIHHLQVAEESFTNSLGETLSKNKESVKLLFEEIVTYEKPKKFKDSYTGKIILKKRNELQKELEELSNN